MATIRKSGRSRKEKAEIFEVVSQAVDTGKSISKKMENGSEEKVRMTAYLKESIHERLLRAITEEKIKQGKKGDKSVQGKLDFSAITNEALDVWLSKRKY